MGVNDENLCKSKGGEPKKLTGCDGICCTGLNPNSIYNYECSPLKARGNFRVVIANNYYTDKNEFLEDAGQLAYNFYQMRGLSQTDMFKISFYAAWSEDLALAQKENPLIDYDNPMANRAMTSCGGQFIITLSTSAGRAGAGSFWINMYKLGNDIKDTYVVSHELSHSLARLADEYVENEDVSAPPDAKPYGLGINVSETYPCNKWSSKPYANQVGCHKGAWYNNWYRPWEKSLMTCKSLELNPPSVEGWEIALKNYKSSETPTLNFTFNTNDTIYHQLLSLTINQDADKNLKLVKQEIQEGYPMDYALNLQDNYYIVRIVDKNNRKLFEGKIRYMDEIYIEDFSTNPPKGTYTSKFTDQLLLNLPVYKTAASVIILDKSGKIKLNIATTNPDSAYSLYDIQDYSSLCGNGLCDNLIGENINTCKNDCQSIDK